MTAPIAPDDPTRLIPLYQPRGEAPELAPSGPGVVRRLLGLIGRVLLLLIVALVGVCAVALLTTPPRENVLILGSDARPDELAQGQVGRTDTMMLLVADRATPRLATLSVPRDLWVTIPGYGQDRINAAYEDGGPDVARQTVANTLGQPVDRYMVVGLQGVRDIVNAVGGIDINVPTAIHDDAYPTDNYGIITVDIPAGQQHMDGDTALEYARSRHQDSDFARAARQQQVLSAVRSAMLNPLNWPRLPATLAAVQRSIRTDVSPFDAIAIGAAVLRNPGAIDHMVIQPPLVAEDTGADGAYLLDPTPQLKNAVASFMGRQTPAAQAVPPPTAAPSTPLRVEVLNASSVSGLARTTGDRLSQQGFQLVGVSDAPQPRPQTTILVRPGVNASALATALGVPANRISEDGSLPSGIDAEVLAGPDLAR